MQCHLRTAMSLAGLLAPSPPQRREVYIYIYTVHACLHSCTLDSLLRSKHTPNFRVITWKLGSIVCISRIFCCSYNYSSAMYSPLTFKLTQPIFRTFEFKGDILGTRDASSIPYKFNILLQTSHTYLVFYDNFCLSSCK